MPTIRITTACTEFSRVFTAGQLVSDLAPLEAYALTLSGLASYRNPGEAPPVWPDQGVIPITTVMQASPALYGLTARSTRTYDCNGVRSWGDGTSLVQGAGIVPSAIAPKLNPKALTLASGVGINVVQTSNATWTGSSLSAGQANPPVNYDTVTSSASMSAVAMFRGAYYALGGLAYPNYLYMTQAAVSTGGGYEQQPSFPGQFYSHREQVCVSIQRIHWRIPGQSG